MQQSSSTIVTVLLLLIFQSTSASVTDLTKDKLISEAPQSVFERLSDDEVLNITIKTDIHRLLENKKDSKYQMAHIVFDDEVEELMQWRVLIKARGKYRNKICDFPPIKIQFDHSVLGSENLKSFKSLKLVTHCGDHAAAKELVQKEYLAYKMYNTITDKSLRVQLVRINWLDSSGEHEIGKKWGFIIENEDEMAQRLQGGIYDEFGVEPEDVNTTNATQHAVFQYMIGNADWNILMNKNISLVKSHTTTDLWVVPYDFDFSGFVNAAYALTTMGQYNIRERVFLGDTEGKAMNHSIALFQSKQKEIIEQIDSFPYLSKSGKKDLINYIDKFYSSLDKPFKGPEFYRERRGAPASHTSRYRSIVSLLI